MCSNLLVAAAPVDGELDHELAADVIDLFDELDHYSYEVHNLDERKRG